MDIGYIIDMITHRDIIKVLDILLKSEEKSECIDIISFPFWQEYTPYVDSEDKLIARYLELISIIKSKYGTPFYQGDGALYNSSVHNPEKYFDDHDSSSTCAWWNYLDFEFMLMITEHDAATLKFVRLAMSKIKLD